MHQSDLSMSIAFVAGLASFLSPCVLPLVPIYLTQLVGQSVYQSNDNKQPLSLRLVTFLHAVTFVCGFTLAFVALGAVASSLGSFLQIHLALIRQIAGVLLIILGLSIAGILKLPFLYQQKRFEFHPERPSYPASFLIGITFAIAWSPCIGPILGSILTLAASTETLQKGVLLLLVYSLGLGVPFLLLGLGLNQVSSILKKLKPHLGKIEIVAGILMVVVGIMVFFNVLLYLNSYFKFGLLS
jgi:cytochrome c-type biogenesis protein